jgi:hypothetical protein
MPVSVEAQCNPDTLQGSKDSVRLNWRRTVAFSQHDLSSMAFYAPRMVHVYVNHAEAGTMFSKE